MTLIGSFGGEGIATLAELLAGNLGFSNNAGNTAVAPTAGIGRFGGRALRFTQSTTSSRIDWTPDANVTPSTFFFGCAFRPAAGSAANFDTTNTLFSFREGAAGTIHFIVGVTTNGRWSLNNSAGTQIAVGGSCSVAWHSLMVGATIADAGGTINVYIDGNLEMTFTGDTRNAGSGYVNTVRMAGQNGLTMDLQDLWFCDSVGSAPYNTYLGDCRVETLIPNGAGTYTNLTRGGTDSGTNYGQVDETTANSDTDYVESATASTTDTYALSNLVTTAATILSVRPHIYARKTNAGDRQIASRVTLSGTDEDSSGLALSTSYRWFADTRITKPGGGAFTVSDVNALEVGPKVAS